MKRDTVEAVGAHASLFSRGLDWEADRSARLAASERRAWVVAGVASALCVILVIALAALSPLRVRVPYVFALDKASGNVELVQAVDDRTTVGYQELVDKHFTTRYVVARESYVFKLLQLDYDLVLALSTDELGREYARQYEGANARDKRLGPHVEIRTEVRSVTLARDGVSTKAVVRFEKTMRRGEGDPGRSETFVATMTYEYKPSMLGTERDLIANPLGFRVTTYRVDAELPSSSLSKTM